MPIIKKKNTKRFSQQLSNDEIALGGLSYLSKKESIKTLTSEMETIRKPLEEYVGKFGSSDEKGNLYVTSPYADKTVVLKKTLRVSSAILPEAIEVLKKHKLTDCLEKVTIIREDILNQMILSGEIPEKILKKIVTTKESYAFSVSTEANYES